MKSLLKILWSFFKAIFSKKETPPPTLERLEEDWHYTAESPAADSAKVVLPPPEKAWPSPSDPVPDPPSTPIGMLLAKCLEYMERKGYVIDREIGGGNIIFVSGYGLDARPNDDKPNLWNDLCFVARMTEDGWTVPFTAECTTAPGTAPALSKDAKERGGVARIVPNQYFAWKIGFHKKAKYGTKHPAFVQVEKVWFSRDFNQDLAINGDKVYFDIIGMNIHAQGPGKDSPVVNFNSEGCLVLRYFTKLQELLALAKDFNIYKKSGPDTIFAATIIEGTDLN